MTIDEINTIRLALDTPEHNRHYVMHVTDAKMILNKQQEAINYTHSCKSVKNTDNETPLDKIKVLTNTLETFRNIPYTSDAITKAIKKIDKLISKL